MAHGLLNYDVEMLVLWGAVLAILAALVVYILGKIRRMSAQNEPAANQLLSKCRELHAQGGLSDEEFRTIKTQLATRLQEELKENGETG